MSEPMTPARLAEIAARVEAATAGPWWWRFNVGGRPELWSTQRGGLVVLSALRDGMNKAVVAFCERATPLTGGVIEKASKFFVTPSRDVPDYQDPTNPDALFIAHARTDIPDLLAEVARLEAENARLREWAALLPMSVDGHAIGLGSIIWGLFEDVEGERFWAVAEVTATYESAVDRTIDAQMLIDRDTRIECEPANHYTYAYHPETGQSAEDAAREIAAAARATTDAKDETP